METSKQATEVTQEIRTLLESVVRLLEENSRRIEEIVPDIARIKDTQNEMLAGLALHERVRRLKGSLGAEEKRAEFDEGFWDSIQAYCRNCTRMVPLIQPRTTFLDEHTTIEAICRNCGTMVVRTLL